MSNIKKELIEAKKKFKNALEIHKTIQKNTI